MRPAILNPLFADARTLAGVGPKIEKLLARALGMAERPARVLDLAFHLPFGLIDRTYRPKLAEAEAGRIATVTVNVLDHKPAPRGRKLPYRVLCTDDTAAMEVVFFSPHEDHIQKAMPPGSRRVFTRRPSPRARAASMKLHMAGNTLPMSDDVIMPGAFSARAPTLQAITRAGASPM